MSRSQAQAAAELSHGIARELGHRIEFRAIGSLRPLGRVARTHPRKQIDALKASLAKFGVVNPILIDEESYILAGTAVLKASQELGYTTVPTVVVSHLTKAEKRAYVLADNRLAELAGWDRSILADEFEALIDLGFEVALTGFSELEIEAISFGEEAAASVEEQEVARPQAPVSRLGDLWNLGGHRIFCGDATQLSSYQTLMGDERARMVFTDPPYNCPIKGHVTSSEHHREFPMAVGELDDAGFQAFLLSMFKGVQSVLSPGAVVDACMDWRNSANLPARRSRRACISSTSAFG
jgi:hypothetical protein